ncbi:MAG: amidohydrolase family protein [Clostridia bacterium]|nr:amidohydrolase family protein [Clostridia bacterium]
MKKIDVHIHSNMWVDLQGNSDVIRSASPKELRETYDKLNIEKGILLPIVSPEFRRFMQSNEEVEFLANKYSDTFFWACCVDPRMGKNNAESDLTYVLNYYKERGAVGVGEVTANLDMDDPLVDNLFYHAEKCGMPVTIHFSHKKYDNYGLIDDVGLPKLERALKKFPNLKILGHAQAFWCEIDDNVTEQSREDYVKGPANGGAILRLMRKYPNLYCDLSAGSGYNAMTRDEEFSYKFIEEFGDRLLFGTDIFRSGQTSKLSDWLDKAYEEGRISKENYLNVCRGNAIRIFKLNLPIED